MQVSLPFRSCTVFFLQLKLRNESLSMPSVHTEMGVDTALWNLFGHGVLITSFSDPPTHCKQCRQINRIEISIILHFISPINLAKSNQYQWEFHGFCILLLLSGQCPNFLLLSLSLLEMGRKQLTHLLWPYYIWETINPYTVALLCTVSHSLLQHWINAEIWWPWGGWAGRQVDLTSQSQLSNTCYRNMVS